jgi:hypothetical protein
MSVSSGVTRLELGRSALVAAFVWPLPSSVLMLSLPLCGGVLVWLSKLPESRVRRQIYIDRPYKM